MSPGPAKPWFALAAFCALVVTACAEEFVSSYGTFENAEQAGAVRRGWIPDFVPRAATEIVEAHDIDTNLQRLRFRAPPDALDRMAANLHAVISAPLPPSRRMPRVPGPWPKELDRGSTPGTLQAYSSILTKRHGAFCVAVDRGAGTAFVWSCPALRQDTAR